MVARPRLLAGALASSLLAGACGEHAPPRDPGPIVLLVSLDSVRRDFLSCYGYVPPLAPEQKTTPNLDRLAAEGALYENAYATSSWTLPSHHTLFSGLPEILHGVELDSQRPAPGTPNLTETMRARGFRTAGFYSGPYLDPRFGFGRGFERYEACYGPELERASRDLAALVARAEATAPDDPALGLLLAQRGEAEHALELASHRDVSSARVSDAALGELERAAEDGRPLFLFLHYFDPHYDYVAPEPFAKRFDPDYAGALDGRDVVTGEKVAAFDPSAPSGRRRVASDRDLEHVRALYAAEIAWTDSEVGRVLDRLDELGLAERTLAVVVGDHGDEFFEHGGLGHRRTLDEEVVRVPFLLRWPGHVAPGTRVAAPVQLADVLPTIEGTFPLLLSVPEGEPSDVDVVGRVVRFEVLQVDLPGRKVPVAAQKVIVIETHLRHALKITRTATWARPGEALDERSRALFDERTAALRTEDVSWIDLDRHPDERDADASHDFTAPDAHEALQRFHDLYTRFLAERAQARPGSTPDDLALQLRALGYVGSEAWQIGADELVLPPPGEELLRRP